MADFELNVKVNGIEQSVKTIGELENALTETNKELSKVGQNTREFKFLENQSKNLEKVLVAVTEDASKLDTSLKGVNQSAKDFNQTINQTAQAANNLDTSGQAVKNTGTAIGETVSKAQSLRTELRKITLELQGLEPGSARFQELSLRAGQLRDTIADTSGVIGSLAGTGVERLGKALSTTAQIGVAGFQGIAAAQALFGTENEELNKTLVKLTALLNLSQAITTFGGLGDKITELKAGFSSLFPAAAASATAITATAVAEEGEAVASTEAAVATSGFALALNALPLVAIITALGLVVAGLISYASAESAAEKEDEKRKKQLEQLKKAQEAQNEAIKKSSEQFAGQVAGFISLTAQIKLSLPGSKERLELIKQSNATYGTTIKNLKDERFFQDQVTKSIADYIAFSRAKFRIDKNNEKVAQEFAKQEAIIAKVSSSLGILTQAQKNYVTSTLRGIQAGTKTFSDLNDASTGFFRNEDVKNANGDVVVLGKSFYLLGLDVEEAAGQIVTSNTTITKYAGSIQTLTAEVNAESNALFKAAGATETKTGKIDKSTEALDKYNQTLKDLSDFVSTTDSEEEKFARKRVERTEDKLDDLEFERDIVLAKIIEEYTAQKKAIEQNVKDETERKRLLSILDDNFAIRTKIVNDNIFESIDIQQKARVENQKKVIDELIIAEGILLKEITFGNNNTNDTLLNLQIRRNQQEIEILENGLLGFEKIQKTKTELLQENLELQKQLEIEKAETERNFQTTEILKYYRNLQKFDIAFNEETGKAKVEINQKFLDEEFKLNEKSLEGKNLSEEDLSKELIRLNKETSEKITTEAEKTENVINTTAVNLNKEANVKKLEADTKYNKAKKDFSQKTDEEVLDSIKTTVDAINEIFGLFANQLSGLFSAITESNKIALDQQLADTEKFYDDKNIKSQNSYDAEKKALNQNLTSGIISQEQYNAAISNLDINRTAFIDDNERKLNAELLTQRQKAFDKEKKLKKAQALISGFQGALTAFTSAFQLGPIAGPVVGAILAGLVAATTAKQVQNIENTKLEGGGSQADTSSTTTTTSQIPTGSSLSSIGGGFTTFNENANVGTNPPPEPPTPTTPGAQRVYVLESDITSTQNRVKVLEDNATFG
jgi:hypothetical protein